MRPLMNQEITIYVPGGGPKDKFGRPTPGTITSEARVQFTSKTVESREGTVYQAVLEIDLPTETPVSYGTEISYTENNVTTKGKVLLLEDVKNLSGTRTDYRTVNVG